MSRETASSRTAPPSFRTALVTGGSGAIGAAIGRRLVEDGHRVVLVARGRDALERVAADIGGEALVADVTDPTWVPPGCDVLVHSAAAYAPYARLEQTDDQDWQGVLDAGPTAAARMLRAVLPGMKARGFGRVVLVGSLAGSLGAHGQAAYAAAKAALTGLARTVALEGGRHGVTANVVELGLIDTPRIRSVVRPEVVAALVAATATGRLGTSEEVAAVVGLLCSDAGAYVTGAVVPVTGGLGLGLPTR